MMMKREEWSTERSDKPRRYEILVHAAHISRAKKEKKMKDSACNKECIEAI